MLCQTARHVMRRLSARYESAAVCARTVEKDRIEPARQISLSARSIGPMAADRF